MIQKLIVLLSQAASGLKDTAGNLSSPDTASEEPKESEEQPAEKDQATPPAPAQAASTPPLSLWQRIISAGRDRRRWLRSHPRVIGLVLVLAIAIVVAEQWLIQAWGWLISQLRLYLPVLTSHPVALVGVGIALFYLLFGLGWLHYIDDFARVAWGGIKRRPRLSTFVGGILLLIGLWLVNNHGTWVVLPFTVGQTETVSLSGEKVAIQLIAELNQIGVGNPTQVLVLWEPQEPHTASGSVTARRNLPLEECDVILRGPGDFTRRSQPIPLTRVLAGSQGSRLDLGNLSIGTVSIPSQLFTQFILRILPTGYREFNGQINESDGELEISISSRNPPNAWRVSGPSDTLTEMMEYLALRMALDLNPKLIQSSGLDTFPSDRDLAFAIGNQAFREGRYRQARSFFELADRFEPLDEKVDAMLGLTYYHLALEQYGNDSSRFLEGDPQVEAALQAMKAAVREDPSGDSSLLRPYLACLYHKVGLEDQTKAERTIFTRYLLRLEFQAHDARVDALKQLPLYGSGRHLSVAGGDVIFVDEVRAIVAAAGRPLEAGLSLPDQNPRQIGLYGDSNLLFVSPDGAVLTSTYQMPGKTLTPTTLIEGRALRGVQQIGISTSQFNRTNLFLLNRFGEIYWCEPGVEAGSTSACPPQQPILSEALNARQIFPTEDQLYILATDGTVWRTEINVSGQASLLSQPLPQADQVQEIFVASDGTLYLLHDNGNVWRYYADDRKLIDEGTGTAQIFAAGGYLYLLKSDGALWCISNPRNPAPIVDFREIWTPPEGVTIQEMFVTAESEGEGTSGSRTVYLLTDQRVLLQGTDVGNARLTLAPISMPAPTQTGGSQ